MLRVCDIPSLQIVDGSARPTQEPMHSVEILQTPDSKRPPDLRIEIKCRF